MSPTATRHSNFFVRWLLNKNKEDVTRWGHSLVQVTFTNAPAATCFSFSLSFVFRSFCFSLLWRLFFAGSFSAFLLGFSFCLSLLLFCFHASFPRATSPRDASQPTKQASNQPTIRTQMTTAAASATKASTNTVTRLFKGRVWTNMDWYRFGSEHLEISTDLAAGPCIWGPPGQMVMEPQTLCVLFWWVNAWPSLHEHKLVLACRGRSCRVPQFCGNSAVPFWGSILAPTLVPRKGFLLGSRWAHSLAHC